MYVAQQSQVIGSFSMFVDVCVCISQTSVINFSSTTGPAQACVHSVPVVCTIHHVLSILLTLLHVAAIIRVLL